MCFFFHWKVAITAFFKGTEFFPTVVKLAVFWWLCQESESNATVSPSHCSCAPCRHTCLEWEIRHHLLLPKHICTWSCWGVKATGLFHSHYTRVQLPLDPYTRKNLWLESISSQVLQTNRLKLKSTQSFSLSHCKAVVWTQARYSHCLLVFQSLPQTLPGKHGRIPTWWYSCLEHCYSVELLFMRGTVQAG